MWAWTGIRCGAVIAAVRWHAAQSRDSAWWLAWQPVQVAAESAGSSVTGVTWQLVHARLSCT
jgi:hypothetical protein